MFRHMMRNAISATLALWLLAAPAVQADQKATLYVAGPASGHSGIRVNCDARWRDMGNSDRVAEGGYDKFLDRCLERCPNLRPEDTQNYYEGRVRRACDATWQHRIEAGAVERDTYEDFISHCARACAPPVAAAPNGGIPQLTDLGAQAAPGAGTAGAGTAGAGAAAGAGAGAGITTSNTVLAVGFIGGLALATGIGVSNDHSGPPDQPASP